MQRNIFGVKKYFDKALKAKKVLNPYIKVAETKLTQKKLKGNHNTGLKSLQELNDKAEEAETLAKKRNLDNKEKKLQGFQLAPVLPANHRQNAGMVLGR